MAQLSLIPVEPNPYSWRLRDTLAAIALFLTTAAVVLWQNSRIGVLWDLSYLLDTAFRLSLGQMPYRDFPFAHAPLTFLIQAAIINLTGRVVFHHILYAAIAGALGTVLTWRIVLRTLTHPEQGKPAKPIWLTALLLALPLTVLGVYGIFPTPFYDCDATLAILFALYLLQRLVTTPLITHHLPLITGFSIVLPVFFKQNIGLPFLLVIVIGISAVLLWNLIRRAHATTRALLTVLASAAATLALAALLLHLTVGLHAYVHWTVTFAAQRRMPPLSDMLGVYIDASLLWTLPCIAAGLAILLLPRLRFRGSSLLATLLLAAPLLRTLTLFFLQPDSDDRTTNLLLLWPAVLLLSALVALWNLRRGLTLAALLPFFTLAAINGVLLSQQLWGSTYAIWPLFVILAAGLLAGLPRESKVSLPLSAIFAATLLLCGSFYLAGEERLSYANVLEGDPHDSTLAALRGLTVRGPDLPALDQLVAFTSTHIPANDGILLINGEDPFYFATGRTPRFPVLLFDPATDPYSPAELAAEARSRNIRWLIVKRTLQAQGDPTPNREETLQLLSKNFAPFAQLDNYDIYLRR